MAPRVAREAGPRLDPVLRRAQLSSASATRGCRGSPGDSGEHPRGGGRRPRCDVDGTGPETRSAGPVRGRILAGHAAGGAELGPVADRRPPGRPAVLGRRGDLPILAWGSRAADPTET